MRITTILFDLDGTLLPMNNDEFTKGYFKLLAKALAPHGYDTEGLIKAIWAGTAAMVGNDGTQSNDAAFWAKFSEIYGEKALADKPLFDEFYKNDFENAKALCGCNPKAAAAVRKLKEAGYRIALATNPIFPGEATESRIRWAGFSPDEFELYTSYENIGFCKPNPEYYRELARRLNAAPEECIMVGNDVTEDMIARSVGMNVFLLTDCLINKEREDINQYPRGSFEQLIDHVNKMNRNGDFENE